MKACEYGKDFIVLFKDTEVGNFIFVRIEQDGSVQFVNNIRYRVPLNSLKAGKIPLPTVKAIFSKIEEMDFWKLKDHYVPVDPNRSFPEKVDT